MNATAKLPIGIENFEKSAETIFTMLIRRA